MKMKIKTTTKVRKNNMLMIPHLVILGTICIENMTEVMSIKMTVRMGEIIFMTTKVTLKLTRINFIILLVMKVIV